MKNEKLKNIFFSDPEILAKISEKESERRKESLTKISASIAARSRIEQFMDTIKGEDGKDGKDGYSPIKGVDYFDGKDGIDGKDGESIVGPEGPQGKPGKFVVGADGKDGKDGRDGTEITSLEIASKLNELTEKVDSSVIKGLPTLEAFLKEIKTKKLISKGDIKGMRLDDQKWHGGGLSTVSHDSSLTGDGTLSNPLSVTAVAAGYQQPTSGAVGQGVFTWAVAPNIIVVDGRTLQRVQTDGTENWTIVGTTTTLVQWPQYDIFALN